MDAVEDDTLSTSSSAIVLAEEIGERQSGGTGIYKIPREAPEFGGGLFSQRGLRRSKNTKRK